MKRVLVGIPTEMIERTNERFIAAWPDIVSAMGKFAFAPRLLPAAPEQKPGDVYSVLGVPRNAPQCQIHEAFIALSKLLHPDMENGDRERFEAIRHAHEILNDPEKRAVYDATGLGDDDKAELAALNLIAATLMEVFDKNQGPRNVSDVLTPIKRLLQKKQEATRQQIEYLKAEGPTIQSAIERIDKRWKGAPAAKEFIILRMRGLIEMAASGAVTAERDLKTTTRAIEILADAKFEMPEVADLTQLWRDTLTRDYIPPRRAL